MNFQEETDQFYSVSAPFAPVLRFVGIVISLSMMQPPASADDNVKSRFLNEYPKFARKNSSSLTGIRGICKLSQSRDGRTGTVNADFAVDHGFTKLVISYASNKKKQQQPKEIVLCGNDAQVFSLKMPPDSPNYVVTSSGNSLAPLAELNDRFRNLLTAPHAVFGNDLGEMIGDPSFEMISADTVKNGDEELVAIRFRYGIPPKNEIIVHLNPHNEWLIQHSEFKFGDVPDDLSIFDVQYKNFDSVGTMPLLVTCKNPDRQYKCEFTGFERTPVSISEFSMEHFHLPDLLKNTKSINYKLWIIASSLTISLVGFVLYLLRRRRS